MTDVLYPHGRDQKGRPSYTKTTVGVTFTGDGVPGADLGTPFGECNLPPFTPTGGEPVIELTEGEVQTMEQWANETDAMTPNPDPMNSMLAGIPFVAIPEESA